MDGFESRALHTRIVLLHYRFPDSWKPLNSDDKTFLMGPITRSLFLRGLLITFPYTKAKKLDTNLLFCSQTLVMCVALFPYL